MCGLVGVAGVIEKKHSDAFNNMLLFNIPRGRDSTGVWSIDRDINRKVKDEYLIKAPVHALDLQEYKGYDRVIGSTNKHCLIGHGRAATVGKINRANAHPFSFDNVAGAHNGTIPTYQMSKLEAHDKFGTDSEALYYNINKFGVEATIQALTGGAWALTWYDKTDHSINLLRNDQRPLFFAVVNDGKTLFWGSEDDIVHAACGRNGIDTSDHMFELPENTWYKWRLPDAVNSPLPKPVVKEVKQKEAPAHDTTRYFPRGPVVGGYGVSSGVSSKYGSLKEAKVIEIGQYKRGRQRGKIVAIEGWNGKRLSEVEFRNRTGETCQYSDDIVSFDDVVSGREKIVFINETQFVKKEYNDPQTHAWLGKGIVDLQGLK